MKSELQTLESRYKKTVSMFVNGEHVELLVRANETLLSALRDQLGLTGTKYGCGTGDCCACTVIRDGQAVLSCLCLVANMEGSSIKTIEGLSDGNTLSHVQKAFADKGAVQCGFCTPGMIMTITSLLESQENPSEEEIRQYLRGNLCRCTGYVKIIDAALEATKQKNGA